MSDDQAPAGAWQAIGRIRSPFAAPEGTPIQASAAVGVRGAIELFERYAPGLADVSGFSHLILVYRFHVGTREDLTVVPFLDRTPRGVFATRAPARPNRIGLSIVRLVGIEGLRLDIADVDVVDGTPLLDIKPYVPAFDQRDASAIGWFEGQWQAAAQARADRRFDDPAPGTGH